MGRSSSGYPKLEKLNFSRRDSRVLRLLRRELAAAENVVALLKE
jgi:hypothetical protein